MIKTTVNYKKDTVKPKNEILVNYYKSVHINYKKMYINCLTLFSIASISQAIKINKNYK